MAVALWARLAIAPVSAGLQYVTFFPAVTLSAVAGGYRAGLLATVVGLVRYLHLHPALLLVLVGGPAYQLLVERGIPHGRDRRVAVDRSHAPLPAPIRRQIARLGTGACQPAGRYPPAQEHTRQPVRLCFPALARRRHAGNQQGAAGTLRLAPRRGDRPQFLRCPLVGLRRGRARAPRRRPGSGAPRADQALRRDREDGRGPDSDRFPGRPGEGRRRRRRGPLGDRRGDHRAQARRGRTAPRRGRFRHPRSHHDYRRRHAHHPRQPGFREDHRLRHGRSGRQSARASSVPAITTGRSTRRCGIRC